MVYTLLSKVGDLLKDPRAVEVVERYVPGISKNPLVLLAKGKTLQSLLELPQAKSAGLTSEIVTKVLAEINQKK
ncbi:MAG: hypothetical protein LC103_06910 [Anaerolineales bacterium]|jgi:hypothetical protein|nr:hypothetical protein [Anaerolineales bacterium]